MFIWDFNALLAIALFFALAIVFGLWVFYTLNGHPGFLEAQQAEDIRQCGYCGYVYTDYLHRDTCRCPRCQSYHNQ